MLEHEPDASAEPEKTLEAHPASVQDLLAGMHANALRQSDRAGAKFLSGLRERWPTLTQRQRQDLVKVLLNAPWVPQATKNALRAADQ